MLSTLFATQAPCQQFDLTIWVDKGCGGEYFVGDMLTVHWAVTHNAELTFWEIEPDGFKRKLHSGPIITGAGQGSRGWTLKDYGYGKRKIYAEAVSIWGMDAAECEFYVIQKAADVQVTVKDQNGQPLSGVTISLDNSIVASTTTTGTYTIPDVEYGEHTITAAFGDKEQSSRIRIASSQKQFLDFVFTVEMTGSIQVRVYTQHGDPLEADIYIDGFREGRTSPDGTFTVSASEGDHYVEATWQNETAGKQVTVVGNQTSFADLTIYAAKDTTLTVLVQDTEGSPVKDANVYLGNIFLGKTDAQGTVQEAAAPGSHTVRVEKQGYTSAAQDTSVQEGENTVTIVLTPEDAAAYSILTLLGFFYLLIRRR
jgi:hypothetical protein